ncbi:MAG: type II toxin-antitoxin system HicA family toxin [Xenococcaceae cyanobacterium]
MPKKIRELKKMLQNAGFQEVPGKGSHTNWIHPLYSGKVTISGKDGNDAKLYQEKEIKQAIQEVNRKRENG